MRYDRSTRRMFLRGLGGAVLAVPFLPSLLPTGLRQEAEAAQAQVPRRFVAIKSYNGAPVLDYYPRVAPPGFDTRNPDGTVVLTDPLPVATGTHSNGATYYGHQAPLTAFADTGLGNIFGTEFADWYASMTLFRGLDFMPNLNHNHGGFLGNLGLRTNGVGGALPGAQINVTIDQVLAQSAAVYAQEPWGRRIVHLGSRTNTCSYEPTDPNNLLGTGENAVQQATAFTNPRVAFDTVFGAAQQTQDGPSLSTLLIDRVMDDYRRAMQSPRLSSSDRQTLERHVTHLAQLEQRLVEGIPTTCQDAVPPAEVESGGEFDLTVDNIREFFDAMVDLTALMLSCDATRIVTLDVQKMVVDDAGDVFGMGDSENTGAAGRSNWHGEAHRWNESARRWLGIGNRWIAQSVVRRLVERLDEITEPDGASVLHHSMVLWGNELSFNHLGYSIPTVMFGNAGGRIRAGRYLDYVDWDRNIRFSQHDGHVIEGVQYNRLLVTILQAMGLSPSDYEIEAGKGFGEYRTVEKNDAWAIDYDESTLGEPLPDLLV